MLDNAQSGMPAETMTLFVEPGSEPIRGWIDSGSGPRRPFSGWLELMTLLHDEKAMADGRALGERMGGR